VLALRLAERAGPGLAPKPASEAALCESSRFGIERVVIICCAGVSSPRRPTAGGRRQASFAKKDVSQV
jgi:hypothetical protein